MASSAIGRRYARAILDLANEGGATDKVRNDLVAIAAAWNESAELREVFENPKVGPELRKRLLESLAARLGLSSLVTRTLYLVADRRRMRQLPDIVESFLELAEAAAGQFRAEVTSAVPLDDAYYEELGRALERATGRRIAIVRRTDPSLLGGVVARVGDKVFDGSLRNRLEELKGSLLPN